MEVDIFQTNIQLTKNSRLAQVNWDNLPFGKLFSDHMFTMDFDNGNWSKPKIMPYGDISISPANSAIHYGQSCFEGMKAHRDVNGDIVLFRPYENARRFNSSNKRMCIPEISEEVFVNSILELIAIDKKWVPQNLDHSLYIRPFIFATGNGFHASPSNEYKFIIATAPSGTYFAGKVKVLIEEKYARAANGGVGFAKAGGNYAAQFYPTQLAIERGYNQVIWTDDTSHEYIEEAGAMNIFVRINDTLITSPTSDRILDGITRKSILQIAKDSGLHVEERKITVTEVIEAATNGNLKELFGAGTAAVISPISGFGFKGVDYDLPELENSYASQLKKKITDIQTNKTEDPYGWRVHL